MARYGEEFRGSRWAREPSDREHRYDAQMRPRRGGGYDSGFRGRGDYRGGRRSDYTEATPGRDLTQGFSEYSSHGPYGGYRGAWDLRPQSAGGREAEQRRRRGGYDRGYDRQR